MDFQRFYRGEEFEAYQFLGAQVCGEGGVFFRVYAPAAANVSVIGEFNGWTDTSMQRIYDGQFWECRIENACPGQMYKYRIYKKDGGFIDHADPYAFRSQLRPQTASVVYDRSRYLFSDEAWMQGRTDSMDRPLNIYELHLSSWRRRGGWAETGKVYTEGEAQADICAGWYHYEELARLLIPYVKENGYNYVEFMPLGEYPADESWGYQQTGFYSATSRYGEPDGLKSLIDECHRNGIGVLHDVVTVHFAVNDYGLWNFDGTALYEYPNNAVGYNEWGSCNFMHSRGDVCSFLQSACDFWLREFHFDGLRFDAVGNLIYWQGDSQRGENRDALRFLSRMNRGLKERFPTAMLIAEDSTAYPKVTEPADRGGLGFDYKWDMGWMHDTLSYFQEWPQRRGSIDHKLRFSMQYFYNERYILPLSHDEVVHGKATILQKMSGGYEQKFPQGRAFYTYMYAHPGKKLDFMGNEFGQLREWDERREQDWNLEEYPVHGSFHRFRKALHAVYLEHPALWADDYDRCGFEWTGDGGYAQRTFAFWRNSADETLLCVFNFSDTVQSSTVRTDSYAVFELLIDSDATDFGGDTSIQGGERIDAAENGYLEIRLPAFGARIYKKIIL